MYLFVLFVLLVIGECINRVDGYREGAPQNTCTTMMPEHDAEPQSIDTSLYSITVNNDEYMPNGTITVTVVGSFKGILLQARKFNSTDTTAIGSFTSPPDKTQLKSCGTTDSSLTHSNGNDKTDIVVTWKPPPITAGKIEFVATIVKEKKEFWKGVKSGMLAPIAGYPSSTGSRVIYRISTLLVSLGLASFRISFPLG